MAEGWAKHYFSDRYNVYSAGVATHGLNPSAVQVMAEAGVDIRGQTSQHLDEFADIRLDLIITVCGHAKESCPLPPNAAPVVHAPFDDPPKLAQELADAGADEETQLACYRRVRDDIQRFVKDHLPDLMSNLKP